MSYPLQVVVAEQPQASVPSELPDSRTREARLSTLPKPRKKTPRYRD